MHAAHRGCCASHGAAAFNEEMASGSLSAVLDTAFVGLVGPAFWHVPEASLRPCERSVQCQGGAEMKAFTSSNHGSNQAKIINAADNLMTQLIKSMHDRQHAQTKTGNLWFVNAVLAFANAAISNKIFSSNTRALDQRASFRFVEHVTAKCERV